MSKTLPEKENSKSRRSFLSDITKWIGGTALLATAANIFTSNKVKAETNSNDPFLGEIIMFGGNFAPRGWALCDGQLLPISANQALFSILGTIYGGDGRTTFGLPDLRGRGPVHAGNGPGLPSVREGSSGGATSFTQNADQMPSHNHGGDMKVNSGSGTTDNPSGNYMAANSEGIKHYANATTQNAYSGSESIVIANTGGGQSVNIRSPYTSVYFIIAIQGTFPSRT